MRKDNWRSEILKDKLKHEKYVVIAGFYVKCWWPCTRVGQKVSGCDKHTHANVLKQVYSCTPGIYKCTPRISAQSVNTFRHDMALHMARWSICSSTARAHLSRLPSNDFLWFPVWSKSAAVLWTAKADFWWPSAFPYNCLPLVCWI